MLNEFEWDKPKVVITDIYGNVYHGEVIDVFYGEYYDMEEDSIDIDLRGGGIKSFFESEIRSIVRE